MVPSGMIFSWGVGEVLVCTHTPEESEIFIFDVIPCPMKMHIEGF